MHRHCLRFLPIFIALWFGLSSSIFLQSRVRAAGFPEPIKIIQDEGQFVFTDGSSYYLLKKDGTFRSGPLGVSGREITGTWKFEDGKFVIDGLWGWINGVRPIDDKRRMVLYLGTPESFEATKQLSWMDAQAGVRIYKSYFIVEELQKLPKPQKSKS